MATVRLLVTGATGFIGRHVLAQLALRKDITVVASARSIPAAHPSRIAFDQADLLEAEGPADLIARVQPTHLLHLAWDARPGLFWTTPGNLRWAAATLDLFESFVRVGGKRAVFAGSGAEYDWTGPSLLSESAETRPATLYGVAKDAVRRIVCMPFASGVSVAWGRVFWLYGDHEPAGRLVSDVVASLASGSAVETTEGLQQRDFIHVEDVAGAFIAALESEHAGSFNIASGSPVPVRRIIELLATEAGRPDLVRYGARPSAAGDPPLLAADITMLRDRIGYRPTLTLEEGLSQTYRRYVQRESAAGRA